MFSAHRTRNPKMENASGAGSRWLWVRLVAARVLPEAGPTLVNRALVSTERAPEAAMVMVSYNGVCCTSIRLAMYVSDWKASTIIC
jgi:hypothetical protein